MAAADPVAQFEERRARQRASALERANSVKQQRKAVRRALRDGTVDPWELLAGELDELEPVLEGWPVDALLKAIPGIGKVRVMDVLVAFKASPSTKMGAFSKARRVELARVARGSIDITVL